jgi:2-polyprenyl-3-methyl-5-hydroxy-6-metoxy-1,4-benzoquinol methylase
MLKLRSNEPELMDDLTLSGEELHRNLEELEVVNQWLGGYKVVLQALEKIDVPEKHVLRIADIGCGAGDTLRQVATWARNRDLKVNLTGIDANDFMVQYARTSCATFPEICVSQYDVFSEEFKSQNYDVIICSLFCHHFTDEQLVSMFSQLHKQAKIAVVINDLHRHWLAYYSIKLLTAVFSGSRLVKNDAPLSVWRAFKREDLKQLVQQAGIKHFDLKWMWAFRWQLILHKNFF